MLIGPIPTSTSPLFTASIKFAIVSYSFNENLNFSLSEISCQISKLIPETFSSEILNGFDPLIPTRSESPIRLKDRNRRKINKLLVFDRVICLFRNSKKCLSTYLQRLESKSRYAI